MSARGADEADGTVEALRQRLAASRAELLRALEGITEREFAADLGDGKSVVRVLAELAAEERADTARARGERVAVRVPEKPLPPQVVHDLAGARYQTTGLLAGTDAVSPAVRSLVGVIASREEGVAERIVALKASR